jgi:hypothetical protein
MKNEEVNKVIAEYMGYTKLEVVTKFAIGNYCICLDLLVPVWERLSVEFSYIDGHFNIHRDNHENSIICNEFVYKKSIQEAAAHATSKAIMALGDENEK